MTATHVIAIFGIVTSCITALIVGQLHRKQMRQNEAFRQNPEAGLYPPPSVATKFFRRNRDLLLGKILPILGIVAVLLQPTPITRWTILIIAANMALLSLNIATDFAWTLARQHMELMAAISSDLRTTTKFLGETVEAVKAIQDAPASKPKQLKAE